MSKLEDFLRMYGSKNTQRSYRYSLAEYFSVIYGTNEHKVEEQAERYFTEQRNVEQDIQNFYVAIKEQPPKTVRLKLAAVRSFLIENNTELTQKFWRRLIGRVKGSRARAGSRAKQRRIKEDTYAHAGKWKSPLPYVSI
jgi:hypothetical protein